VPDERCNPPAGLVNVERVDHLVQPLLKRCQVERLVPLPISALAHMLLQVRQVELGVVGRIPDYVLPVPTLDPPFPSPAKDSVHLAGKKVGKHIDPHGKRDGLKDIARLGFKTRRRVRVDLEFDFQSLSAVDAIIASTWRLRKAGRQG